MQKGFGHLRKM
jgi:cation-transporting ATPase 13A1